MNIGDLFTISKGKKPPTLFDNPTATSIPFIKIQGIRSKEDHQYCEPSNELVTCDKNDILLVWDGAYCGLSGFGIEGAIGSTIARLRPKSSKVFGPYVGHFLSSIFKELQKHAIGAAIPHINGGHLRRLEVPLPSLDKQKKISALLDKADTLRHQRQESLKLTEKLIHSIFMDMFIQNPAANMWAPRSVNWMADNKKGAIRTGPFGSQLLHSEFVDHGVAVLGIDNAVKNRFEWGQMRFVTPEKYETLKRYKVFSGDLIVTIMGTVGRCAIVPENIPDAINSKHLCCITLDHSKCLPEFLQACLLHHPDVLRQLGGRIKGAVMPGLNMRIIKELEIPLPPVELQERFRRMVAAVTASRINLQESEVGIENLFITLLQRAFQGDLNLDRLQLSLSTDARITSQVVDPVPANIPQPIASIINIPNNTEISLKRLDKLIKKGEQIQWSADYFKYRILGAQYTFFTFNDIMQTAESIFDEPPPYEEIKTMILNLISLGENSFNITQTFDEGRKEIVLKTTL